RGSLLLLAIVAAVAADHKCGYSNVRPNLGMGIQTGNAITGAQEAIAYSWPWQAIVCVEDWLGDCSWKCSATIIGDRWVMTTASCVAGRAPKDLRVRVGVFHPYSKEKQEVRVKVDAIYPNPAYSGSVTKKDNVALIQTDAITFGDYAQPICITDDDGDALDENKMAWVTGWGYPKKGGSVEHTLQQAKVEINDKVVCERTWNQNIYVNEICAGDGGKTICNNDEGDPLAVQAPSGAWFMHGNAAASDPDCKLPGIFTKVSSYCSWISALTNDDVKCIKRA
ncbi:hypothetical protein PENTCL1PPCAC_21956, partial [Pristionchus entomophagus]